MLVGLINEPFTPIYYALRNNGKPTIIYLAHCLRVTFKTEMLGEVGESTAVYGLHKYILNMSVFYG